MHAAVGYQDLLARRALGKLEGGDGVRGVCGSNRDADLEINWNLTPISEINWNLIPIYAARTQTR